MKLVCYGESIPKSAPPKYRMTNWSAYNLALKQRSSLEDVWFDPEMQWLSAPSWGRRLTTSGEFYPGGIYGTDACSYSKTTLIELAPERPVNRGVLYDHVTAREAGRGWTLVKGARSKMS